MQDRVVWSDIAKALAIIMVVWNHAITGAASLGLPQAIDAWTSYVHVFNLAAFYFVAGLFVCRSVQRPVGSYVWHIFRLIYYPMVLWSILQGTLYALAGGYVEERIPLWQPLVTSWYSPDQQLGFLMSLMAGRFLFLAADRLRIGWKGIGLAALAGIGVYGLMWADPPALPITPDSLLWMAAGAGFAARMGRDRLPLGLAAAGFVAAAAAGVAFHTLGPQPLTSSFYTLALMRGLGMISVLLFAMLLSHLPPGRWLAWIGQRSLPIFLAHLILTGGVRVALVNVLGLEDAMTVGLFSFAAGLVGPLVMLRLLGRRWIFEFPDRLARSAGGKMPAVNP